MPEAVSGFFFVHFAVNPISYFLYFRRLFRHS